MTTSIMYVILQIIQIQKCMIRLIYYNCLSEVGKYKKRNEQDTYKKNYYEEEYWLAEGISEKKIKKEKRKTKIVDLVCCGFKISYDEYRNYTESICDSDSDVSYSGLNIIPCI